MKRIFETKRLYIEEANDIQINKIIALESHPENRDYLWVGTAAEHKAEIRDPNHILCVFKEKDGDAIIGYALIRLDFKSKVFELRRLAIGKKGIGYGKEVMKGIIDYAFNEKSANRFWLDVYPDNIIGINLYESLGMHRDGVLRQSYKSERGYLDQIIYSILREEYIKM